MKHIDNLLKNEFSKTTLEKMSRVHLLNRTDTKFIFNVKSLFDLLLLAKEDYLTLVINDESILDYSTQYYDTEDFEMYRLHQNKKLNRYKIRQREYLISNIGFMEIKFKSNKKRTIKSRFKIDRIEDELSAKSITFINEHSIYDGHRLVKSLLNKFSRITLVHKTKMERVTVDFNLNFCNEKKEIQLPYLAIVEVKREGNASSELISLLKQNKIYQKSFSKYSIGTLLLNPTFKGNSFKRTLLTLEKIKNYA